MNLNKRRIGAYQKGSDKSPQETSFEKDSKLKKQGSHPNGPEDVFNTATKNTNETQSILSKTVVKDLKAPVQAKESSGKPSKTEIAKYLMLIGKEDASKILKHLNSEEVEAIVREIASIGSVKAEEAELILRRFQGLVKTGLSAAGGLDTARSILVNAFGEEKGGQLLRQALPKEEQEPFFSFLQEYEANQVNHVLKNEPLGVKSIVLAYLPPAFSASLLKDMPKEEQKDLIIRLSKMQRIEREVLVRIEDALKERIRNLGKVSSEDMDGKSNLAAIMRHLDPDLEQRLFTLLEGEAPEVARDIKDRLFTIETLLLIEDRDLQRVLTGLENKTLALLLKGKSEDVRKKILNNLSDNRASLITEEYQNLGPKPKREVDEATRDFIALLRNLEQDGKLSVRRKDEEYI